jgi:hypothetical protein
MSLLPVTVLQAGLQTFAHDIKKMLVKKCLCQLLEVTNFYCFAVTWYSIACPIQEQFPSLLYECILLINSAIVSVLKHYSLCYETSNIAQKASSKVKHVMYRV